MPVLGRHPGCPDSSNSRIVDSLSKTANCFLYCVWVQKCIMIGWHKVAASISDALDAKEVPKTFLPKMVWETMKRLFSVQCQNQSSKFLEVSVSSISFLFQHLVYTRARAHTHTRTPGVSLGACEGCNVGMHYCCSYCRTHPSLT